MLASPGETQNMQIKVELRVSGSGDTECIVFGTFITHHPNGTNSSPHVFSMLSPQGEATDLDFAQFKGMLDATCYIISHMRACLSVI